MSVVLAGIRGLARILRCNEEQAQDEAIVGRNAQRSLELSRRGLFIGLGAAAAGTTFSFPDIARPGYYFVRWRWFEDGVLIREELRETRLTDRGFRVNDVEQCSFLDGRYRSTFFGSPATSSTSFESFKIRLRGVTISGAGVLERARPFVEGAQ